MQDEAVTNKYKKKCKQIVDPFAKLSSCINNNFDIGISIYNFAFDF